MRRSRRSSACSVAPRATARGAPGLIAVLAELGMVDDARRELGRLVGDGIGALRPSLWVAALVYLTDACAMLRDEALAATLYRELLPHAGSNTMVGHLVACYGATDRYLGMNAAVLGEWERAEEHFEAALALNTRLGARTWLAHTAHEYARMLLARDGSGDRQRARTQLSIAVGLARSIGMPTLLARIDELRAESTRSPSCPTGSAHASSTSSSSSRGALEPRDRPHPPHQRAHGREPHPLDPP